MNSYNKAECMNNVVRGIDRLHAKIIVKRGPCVMCGNRSEHCSHLFTRKAMSTRWDISPDGNCHPMCAKCHHRHHNHGSKEYRDWYVREFGEKAYYDLLRRHNSIKRWTTDELYELHKYLNGVDT